MKAIFLITPIAAVGVALTVYFSKSHNTISGNTHKAVDPVVQTPVPFRDFEVNADRDDTLKLEEGTKIFIPSGTFVDASGKAVTGKIQLHYRAFYSQGDIIASGITMRYDTAGTAHPFSSAGMFELNAAQNGKEISIAPKKSISLDFASTRNDNNYSFYSLDTASGNWNFISTTKADSNETRMKLESEMNSSVAEKPIEPKQYDSKKTVIDIDVDQRDHPELSGFNGIVWQWSGTGNDPEKNDWIYSSAWNSVQIVRDENSTCTYDLTMKNGEKSFSTKVFPTLKGSSFTRALSDFKMKMEKFLSFEKIRKACRQKLANVPLYQRAVAITRTGIHNCDAFGGYGNVANTNVEFHFEDPAFESNRANITVYCISNKGAISVAYNALKIQNMFYLPEKPNCLIAVLKGTTRAAVLNTEDFSSQLNPASSTAQFKLKSVDQPVSNSNDINKLIGTL